MRPHRTLSRAVAATAVLAVAGATGAVAVPAGSLAVSPPAGVRYSAPVALRVLRGFDESAGPYGPGHRGVDLAATPGAAVRTAAPGTVTFAGSVAGRGVVVVRHADGVRTEYEPLRPAVRRGAEVGTGTVLGVVAGRHASCAPASCLHWGARRGERYLDPLTLLRPLGSVRLLPWRG